MMRILRFAIGLLAPICSSLHAETEGEFVSRVTAAWESKDPEKVLALYGEATKLGPEIGRSITSQLDWEFKNRSFKGAQFIPFMPGDGNPFVREGLIAFSPKASGAILVSLAANGSSPGGSGYSGSSLTPVVKNPDGSFALGASTVKSFDWTGPKLIQFGIRMRYEGGFGPCPSVVVVTESCGYTNWTKVSDGFTGIRAHKILQLIVPPTAEPNALSFEIAKDDAAPFFQKTVDATKGAIIPVEP